MLAWPQRIKPTTKEQNALTRYVLVIVVDKVRKDARIAWNNYLSKIDITTSDKEDKAIFYTALYHTGISPNLFTDADGRYLYRRQRR